MREALALDVVVLYLPRLADRPSLRAVHHLRGGERRLPAARRRAFDDEAWGLAVASGAPIVFREEASWLVSNPFLPAAQSWLVLPLVSERRLVGVVVAAAGAPLSLDPTAATVLTLLGDLLAAGIATARMRQQLHAAEIERERGRLAAEIHDGLAQDLALATRELALLDSRPARARPRQRGAASRGGRLGAPGWCVPGSRTSRSTCPWAVCARRWRR